MNDLTRFHDEVLANCREDHVGLWELVWIIRRELPEASGAERRRLTLELLRPLLESRRIVAGFPTSDGKGFAEWPLAPDRVLAHIDTEWSGLDHDPDIGDVVWFTIVPTANETGVPPSTTTAA